ncbi:MAG: carboxypeptidase regulatory-like domain-containing protein [Candidatus Binatia bacterium]
MRVPPSAIIVGCILAAATQVAAQSHYREIQVTNGGTITGHVRVTGQLPALPAQPVFKHQDRCGKTIPDERLVVGKDGALRNAVVYLENVAAGKAIPRQRPVKLDNVKCAFVPHVLTATAGQMIQIHNSDPFLHDADARLGARTLFNVAVPKGRTVHRPLAYPGLVDINCNVRHTWMHAYLFIGENPYHTVTDAQGRFRLEQVPPGTYTLNVWHELLGSTERDVTVESGKTANVDVTLPASAAKASPRSP